MRMPGEMNRDAARCTGLNRGAQARGPSGDRSLGKLKDLAPSRGTGLHRGARSGAGSAGESAEMCWR